MEEVKILLTPPHCKIIKKKKKERKKAVAVWSSLRKNESSFFPLCYDVFKNPSLPNHPVSFYIMPMLCNTVIPCILHCSFIVFLLLLFMF